MSGTNYIVKKLHEGKLSQKDPADYSKKYPRSSNFVIAILGLRDEELAGRNEDLKVLIDTVRKDPSLAVTLVLYDVHMKKSRVFPHNVPGIGIVKIVALKPLLRVYEPGLNEAMEASYLLSPEDGKQVDFALSDWSSPAWSFTHMFQKLVIPYMKVGSHLFLHNPPPESSGITGGQYYFVPPTQRADGPANTNPVTIEVIETKTTSPFPHRHRAQPDMWACPKCTFVNDSGTQCAMCESKRPAVGGFQDAAVR
jgi:hypothetical protein